MLRQLEQRQHFVESAHMYSLQDLIDLNSGVLVDYLTKIHSGFASHIKKECLVIYVFFWELDKFLVCLTSF